MAIFEFNVVTYETVMRKGTAKIIAKNYAEALQELKSSVVGLDLFEFDNELEAFDYQVPCLQFKLDNGFLFVTIEINERPKAFKPFCLTVAIQLQKDGRVINESFTGNIDYSTYQPSFHDDLISFFKVQNLNKFANEILAYLASLTVQFGKTETLRSMSDKKTIHVKL